jgi:hypothetical protein
MVGLHRKVYNTQYHNTRVMMQKKRSSDRRGVIYYLDVRDQHTGEEIGRIGNISQDGVMLLGSQRIPQGKRLDIIVALPDNQNFPERTLSLSVEARWVKPDFNPSIFCTGCRLIAAPPEKEDVLARLIEYYGFSDGYKTLRPPE